MHLILYVFLIVIMSHFIMYFVSDDKNKGDQSYIPQSDVIPIILCHLCCLGTFRCANRFSWYLIFSDASNISHFGEQFSLKII